MALRTRFGSSAIIAAMAATLAGAAPSLADHSGPGADSEPSSGAPDSNSDTYYLLFGGGTSPFNTQVSIEEHMARMRKLLLAHDVGPDQSTLLFGHGQLELPMIEVLSPNLPQDPLLSELAQVFDQTRDRTVTWQPSQLEHLDGEAGRPQIKRALKSAGEHSRTVIYFAGHGYRASKSGQVMLGIWDHVRVSPRELARWLDPVPETHRVIAILTQCYAGGFAEFIYEGADSSRAIDDHDRCGFFAAPPEHPSSGCTSAANRRVPDDYSTWFISALEGHLPSGKRLPSPPDIDEDGQVSFAEAHAFASVHDRTLDVPVSTSDFYVQTEWELLDTTHVGTTLASRFSQILKKATPLERHVMESLARELGIGKDPAVGVKARYEADRLARQQALLEDRAQEASTEQNKQRQALRGRLLEQWPQLVNPYHPLVRDTMEAHRGEILAFLREAPERQRLDQARSNNQRLREQIFGLREQWALWERLARTAERVVMEVHLRELGSDEQRRTLDRLLLCESDVPFPADDSNQ